MATAVNPGGEVQNPLEDNGNIVQPFSSDAPLWFNVGIWGQRGYGIPNPGLAKFTVNEDVEEFVAEGGKRISILMHDEETMISDPPSLNVAKGMIGFCNRARQLLLGRAVAENAEKFKSDKVVSPRMPLKVFPCPYWHVKNRLMKSFCGYGFAVLAELMQSSDHSMEHDIRMVTAVQCVKYVARFQKRLAMECFGMTEAEAGAADLNLLTPANLARYTPIANGFLRGEAFDTGSDLSWPQEYQLGPLADGIPIVDLPTSVQPYPYTGDNLQASGVPTEVRPGPAIPDFPVA